MIINIIFFNSFGQDFLESRLQNDTDALLANLNPDENGRLTFDEENVNPIFLTAFVRALFSGRFGKSVLFIPLIMG